MKKHYIQATIDLILAGTNPQVVLEGLHASMKKKGHERLYASVLRGVVRILESKDVNTAKVSVASEADVEKFAAEIKEMLTTLGSEGDHTVVIDKTLIGGVVAKYNNIVIDRSYKTALTNLYRATLR
jgi:F0F1-type ATP synthase delta subunit